MEWNFADLILFENRANERISISYISFNSALSISFRFQAFEISNEFQSPQVLRSASISQRELRLFWLWLNIHCFTYYLWNANNDENPVHRSLLLSSNSTLIEMLFHSVHYLWLTQTSSRQTLTWKTDILFFPFFTFFLYNSFCFWLPKENQKQIVKAKKKKNIITKHGRNARPIIELAAIETTTKIRMFFISKSMQLLFYFSKCLSCVNVTIFSQSQMHPMHQPTIAFAI